LTPIIITQAAMKPAMVKTTIMAVNILPRRFMSDIPATADEMEKKTRGMTIVKRRLRNISPSGLSMAAFFLKTIPRTEPIMMDIIKMNEKP